MNVAARRFCRALIVGTGSVLLIATGAIGSAFLLSPAAAREATPWVNVTTKAPPDTAGVT
jgi:hypothetical protein